jgi:DNA-binding winged helix-turn-helix (wHTH) protein/Flp pilus assembly protein TadD/predicted negative regulator of RcsB-dependent stress response
MSFNTTEQVYFEDYLVDRARRALQWKNEPIAISRKTFDLLIYLIDRRNAIAGKEELLSALWPKQVVEESNLTQQIFMLRKALSRHGSRATIIETVPGHGYRFAARLEAAPQRQDGNVDATSLVMPEHRNVTPLRSDAQIEGGSREPRVWQLILAAAMLVIAGLYGWHYWQNHSTGKSLAVVLADFDEANGDPALDSALNAAIRIDLSESPFVKVLSPAAVGETLAEMRQPKDVGLTTPLAREVCERNASQVVLQGNASKFGVRYLVSLRATSCLSGELLAEAKREVGREDDLPGAIDELAAAVRSKLGESRASIRSFDKPLTGSHTASLAALKAYTAGMYEYNRGDFAAALPLLQQAVQIDPDYGDAYVDVAASYYNLGDLEHAVPALKKAYELRDTMGESNRMYVTGAYYQFVEEDLEKSVQFYKAFAALSPSANSLGQLADAYYQLGGAPLGLQPAQRALAFDPSRQALYSILAGAQLQAGLPAEAAHTCELAIAKNPDDQHMRDALVMADYARHDEVGVNAQLDWSHAHRGSLDLELDEINIALARGEVRHARSLLQQLNRQQRASELQSDYENSISTISRMLADEGLAEDSAALTKLISPATVNQDLLVALAESGFTSRASEALSKAMHDHPHSTLWIHVAAPQVEAAILLAQHKAGEAVHALEPALGFEKTTFGNSYLRGEAYSQLGLFDQAIDEFKKITDSQWVDPMSNLYPLSFLEMARAQVQQRNFAAAKASYSTFLNLWRTADPDAEKLTEARRELAGLL